MSLNHILDQGIPPQSWTNLYVNSIKTNSLSYVLPESGTVRNIYLDPAGSDSNTGLTTDSPVLTFKKAINIAQDYSAEQCVFNLQGTGNISGFSDCYACTDVDKLLDFRPLVTNYSHVIVKGERTDVVSIGAGVAGESPTGPDGKFIKLTGFTGLGINTYTRGFLQKNNSNSEFDVVYNNQATFVQSTRPIGFAAAGFDLYNLGDVQIFDDSKWGIASFIPVSFQDITIASPTTAGNYIENINVLPIKLYGCYLKNQKASNMMKGLFDFTGCSIEGTVVGGNYSFVFEDSIVNFHNCQIRESYVQVSDAPEWRSLFTKNTGFKFTSATYDIIYWQATNDNVTILELSESQGVLDYVYLYSTHDVVESTAIQCIGSSIRTDNFIEVIKAPVLTARGYCLNLTNNSHIRINGDCVFDAQVDFAISLSSNSSLILLPKDSGNNEIKSYGNSAISCIGNSNITLNSQTNKTTYEITSSATHPIVLLYNSFANINTPQATGPTFFYGAAYSIASVKYDSTIRFADALYFRDGKDGTPPNPLLPGSVLLGAATSIPTSGGAGDLNKSAIDAALGVAGLADGQNCIVTFGAV